MLKSSVSHLPTIFANYACQMIVSYKKCDLNVYYYLLLYFQPCVSPLVVKFFAFEHLHLDAVAVQRWVLVAQSGVVPGRSTKGKLRPEH